MAQNHDHHDPYHVMPFPIYVKVAAALFALTFLTMLAFWVRHSLGAFAAPVAFLIAAVKASLVMMYFMHLKYDNWMNRLIFGLGFFFLALLFGISILDILTRYFQGSVI